jgi:hypothetical protein
MKTYTARVQPLYNLKNRTAEHTGETTKPIRTPFEKGKWHRKIDETIEKGGPGSGCNPQVGECGRPSTGTTEQVSTKALSSANEYVKQAGLPEIKPSAPVKVDINKAKRISEAYSNMKSDPNDPQVKKAYSALGKEVDAQFKALPVKVEFTKDDPYKSSQEMFDDVEKNGRLKVFTGGEEHPLLGQKDENRISQNDKFRAVHDYYGHAMFHHQFGPNGEENAWVEHSKMFTRDAQKAMTTETRGQNSWFNYSKENEGKAPKDRSFAEQKVGILPEEFLPWNRLIVKFIKGGEGSGCNPDVGDCGRKPSGNKAWDEPIHSGTHIKQFLKTNNVVIATTDKSDLSPEKNALRNKELETYLNEKKIPYRKGNSSFGEWGKESAYIINAPTPEDAARLKQTFFKKYKQDAILQVRNGHATGEYQDGRTLHGNVDKLKAGPDVTTDYFEVDGTKFRLEMK